MSRVLLLGSGGQVGGALLRLLAPAHQVAAPSSEELDLGQAQRLRAYVREHAPALIVNAAAYTGVDRAEGEPERARVINEEAPAVLAEEAARLGSCLIHYSTDYVFDGRARTPYGEGDAPHPLGVYGRTKLAGDQAIMASDASYLIFRTAWLYGLRGHNFLLTMQRLLTEREEVGVVGDQVGAPTWCEVVARATTEILAQGDGDPAGFIGARRGLYNLACTGQTSWCGFAQAIRAELARRGAGPLAQIKELRTEEYPTPARRPAYSVLDTRKVIETFALTLPDWRSALRQALERWRPGVPVAR
ncbi:MAG: dTDP-4-dehydrorhamnose reductase [Gammaproteobacteria bacterium]|nr:dTDP-4-dehydrorhamnose reductase [Gammaproteobacteria bacterium]NIR98780.1 dTDP-4-dehydrorhamnose reductase [Gammaproteobacteria bacterium]NIT64490.1 dTDP-4-dehydrorhamnose reductase [Gammaproteobacteria bacterium]NIV21410.1 dTDP-4-dehydrorhamnose reductase [Gammaproteobacteria bacterium]NIX11280.1 dTDP-4-dehydrorhamnose reductase [Gammaproteobacteria bacterium]